MTTGAVDMARLYEVEHGRLRALVRRMVGSAAVAEDVVQQAFVNIIARNGPTAVPSRAYVVTAARNLALNHIRDARRRGEGAMTDADMEAIADTGPDPETVTLFRSELRRLLAAVERLSPRRREAFSLNRILGLSYDEVAGRMGISRNTVISLIVAAMAELDSFL